MNRLSQQLAQRIIQQLGGPGQPPDYGVQYFSVGLDDYLNVIDEEYLSSYIRDGGSIFKLVEGIYGGGKTHFLYCVRDKGWAHGFVVSYISLKTGGECPFDRLDLVYKAVAGGLLPPVDQEASNVRLEDKKGLQNFLQNWYATRLGQLMDEGKSGEAARKTILEEDIETVSAANIHSTSFRYAIEHALRALVNDDTLLFDEICQWLKGEAPPTTRLKGLRIVQKLDRTTAFSWIRSLNQVIRALGYSGLVILLDEAERVASMGTKQREQLLSNLRELIDECGKSDFQYIMIFYAVPDRSFLDGRTAVYEALNQRLSTTFDYYNHSGVAIKLDNSIPDREDFLRQVGDKIVDIYNIAYPSSLPDVEVEPIVQQLAERVVEERFADDGYKRMFVQQLVGELNTLRRQQNIATVQANR